MAGSQAPVPEPGIVLGSGARDAALLLALWLLRRSVWTLLWLGVIGLVLAGELEAATDLETPEITSAADIREVATSPRVLLVLAPVARFGSGWLGLAAAYPLARRFERTAARDIGRTRRHPTVWSDRWYLMQALRDWRWTSAVRRLARSRLGRAGTAVLVADITLLVAGIVLFPVALVVLVRALI
jgi:hypothetical protein